MQFYGLTVSCVCLDIHPNSKVNVTHTLHGSLIAPQKLQFVEVVFPSFALLLLALVSICQICPSEVYLRTYSHSTRYTINETCKRRMYSRRVRYDLYD